MRLFNRLAKRFVTSYKTQLDEFGNSPEVEWWLRIHLIVDHISGMTDEFALETFQMLEGIRIHS